MPGQALPRSFGDSCSAQNIRTQLLRSYYASVESLVAIAILLDISAQYLIFHNVHPGAALILGPVLISMPYALARAFANRISRPNGPGICPACKPIFASVRGISAPVARVRCQ